MQHTYLDRFDANATSVDGRDALVVLGAMTTPAVSWGPALHALSGQPVTVGNSTAVGVLLIRGDGDDAWALCYGMGFQALDQAKVDPRFGQRVAVRAADPRELSSLTRTTLDERSRTDRFSIPSVDHLRGFGVGDFGEVVTRLVAKANIPRLAGQDANEDPWSGCAQRSARQDARGPRQGPGRAPGDLVDSRPRGGCGS